MRRYAVLVVIVIAAIAAFAPAVTAPFLFDDIRSIPQNSTIEAAWPPAAALAPPRGIAVSGRPIVNYTLAINHAINEALGIDQRASSFDGRATVGYHVVNLALHVMCGLLLFGLVRRTLINRRDARTTRGHADGIALAVTAVWLLHPLQTEAVDYVIQRTELLVSVCYAGTLYASLRAWDTASPRRRWLWYLLATLLCLMGMGSKEVMISAPIAVMLYDRAFRARSWRELWSREAGRLPLYLLLLATTAWLIALVSEGSRSETVGFALGITWPRYLVSQAWAIGHYLWLLVWPRALSYDYGREPVTGLRAVPGALVLLAFGAATLTAWTRDRWRGLAFLGTVFFLLLGPSSSFIPIRTEIAAERRIYLASAAIIVLGVLVMDTVWRRVVVPRARGSEAWIARAAIGLAAVALFATTFRRSALYRDPEALWRDALIKVPSNARAYEHLAAAILKKDRRRLDEAASVLARGISVDSTYVTSFTNLADVELQRGHTAEAHQLLVRALRINPDFVDASARLGGVVLREGHPDQAVALLERVTIAHPSDETLVTLAKAYMALDRKADGLTALRRALQLNPAREDAASFLGADFMEQGRPNEAIPYLELAVHTDSVPTLVVALLSLAYAQVGRIDESMTIARSTSGTRAADERVPLAFGRAMMIAQRVGDADQFFSEAVQLAPNDPEAVTRLGIARAAAGKDAEARAFFRRALQILPSYGPAQVAIARLDATQKRAP